MTKTRGSNYEDLLGLPLLIVLLNGRQYSFGSTKVLIDFLMSKYCSFLGYNLFSLIS